MVCFHGNLPNFKLHQEPYYMRIFLLVFIFFISLPGYGQREQRWLRKGYQPGYIITHKDDTSHGYLMDRTSPPFMKLFGKVRLKSNTRGLSGRFGPYQIKKYCISNQCYVSIWLDKETFFFRENYFSIEGRGRKVFLKVIFDDYLSLYHLEYLDQESSTVHYTDFFKRDDETSMVRVTQGIFGLKKKLLSEYFNDYPLLVEKINNKEITDPVEVAAFYNRWKKVCK